MIRLRHATLPLVLALAACGPKTTFTPPVSNAGTPRTTLVVRDTTIRAALEVSGVAAPVREATLGTRLMGSVTEVLVHEGQLVQSGDLLARIDARDVNAKAAQAAAGVSQAEAVYDNARVQAARLRALYADSAAPKAQLDDAEAGLARAEAGVRQARGAAAEVEAMRAYAEVRAPFDGTIVKRFVDPGAFVAPGAPLIGIQDASRLRLSVTIAPADARGTAAGTRLAARVEEQPATAVVEGVVPSGAGALYVINALIDNPKRQFLAGAAGTLLLPRAPRGGILIPATAIVHEGDMTGVYVHRTDGTAELRWLELAPAGAGQVEVRSGLRAGETIEMPAAAVRGH